VCPDREEKASGLDEKVKMRVYTREQHENRDPYFLPLVEVHKIGGNKWGFRSGTI